MNARRELWTLLQSILVVSLTCLLLPGLSSCSNAPPTTAPAEPTITPTTMASPVPSITTAPSPSPLPESTATPELSRTGPWWIAYSPQIIWIMNSDGTGFTTLDFPGENRSYPANLAIAPDGKHLAFLAGYDLAEGISLYVVDLPSGTYRTIDVLPPFEDFSIDDYYPGTASFDMTQARIAIRHDASLAWSPDSSQLAFLGWMDGSSVDLYLYDLVSDDITQLTDGPSHAFQVYWSPDGRYLLHAGVDTFGTGAGYSMAGLWVVDLPRDSIYDVDMGMLRGDFLFHGWLDDETFLAASFSAVCGVFNLRAVNLQTGQVEAIWPSSYGAFDIDPSTWTMLLDAPDYAVGDPLCNGQDLAGLVIVDDDGEARQINSGIASRIVWSEALNAFIVEQEERVSLLSREGMALEELPAFPCLLPNGADWVFLTDGAPRYWVGPAGTLPEIESYNCENPYWAWNPAGSMVLYLQNDDLYIAQAPEFDPRLVAEGLTPIPIHFHWTGVE